MGPPLRTEHCVSTGFLKAYATGQRKQVSDDGCAVVDVREVGSAHLNAIKLPAAANHRFILVGSSPKWIDFVKPVADALVPKGYPVTTTKGAKNPKARIT